LVVHEAFSQKVSKRQREAHGANEEGLFCIQGDLKMVRVFGSSLGEVLGSLGKTSAYGPWYRGWIDQE